jgi:hypothetical protein
MSAGAGQLIHALTQPADTQTKEMNTMAKTDSFFIRAKIATAGPSFNQTSIDLGSYVDALGKSVLRIHGVSVQYGSPTFLPTAPNNDNGMTAYQLTTQSQGSMVDATDRSLISSGRLVVGTAGQNNTSFSDMADLSPEMFRNGYLVAVEQIYLGTDSVPVPAVDQVSVVLECTVETLSQSAAMALALSQQ